MLKKKIFKKNELPKIIVVVGPTASGKTKLAIDLAGLFNGEIVSADSRQIYKDMNIGTGKDLAEYKNIKYHLIDIVKPDQCFNVAKFKNEAIKKIKGILNKGKLPLLVGGTGLWISAIVDNYDIPNIKPNVRLRQKISKMNGKQKLAILTENDPDSLKIIDLKNPRRIDRALEIVLSGLSFSKTKLKNKTLYDCLQIGVRVEKEKLQNKINKRVDQMVDGGLVEETKKLIKKYGEKTVPLETIGYAEIIDYLQGKSSLDEAIGLIKLHTRQYAKRQLTWFKRDKKIKWVNSVAEAEKLVKGFLVKGFID